MYRWLRPILFLLPAEFAHRLGMLALRLLGAVPPWRRRKRARLTRSSVDLSVRAAGLTLPNPIGLGAGLDKNAEAVAGLFALGFGALEVGTVTPRAQPGNPKPRLFRIPERQALINRMGFNNDGAPEIASRLARVAWRPAPLGGNVGMNKDTPLERAAEDYLQCAALLAPVCDYLVINASSPNTPGLRDLQEPERLASLLSAVRSATAGAGKHTPLFLKIAPDLSADELNRIVEIALASKIEGLIATNTTVQRPFLHPLSSQPGGLSGAPLRQMATETVRQAFSQSRGRLTIVGSGGVFSGTDAYEKIRAGASWVQLYTALIYQGPGLIAEMLHELQTLLARDGFTTVADAVGTGPRGGASQFAR
jgi:dihydroorotate dehydrogenase